MIQLAGKIKVNTLKNSGNWIIYLVRSQVDIFLPKISNVGQCGNKSVKVESKKGLNASLLIYT